MAQISYGEVHLKKLNDVQRKRKDIKKNGDSCELKKHETWFDEGCSKLLDQGRQAIVQTLQDPSEINGDNLKNISVKPA
jgi:hypothetical protein